MNISQITACTNCGSCRNACPTQAISVDQSGLFYRPVVDAGSCVDCGSCLETCPLSFPRKMTAPVAAYCAQHRDTEVRAKSSSGGAFSALAEQILEKGGVVFGAVFRQAFTEVGFDDSDHVEIDAIRRSKYVESLTGDSFAKIRAHLDAGRLVLFCGTPCQAAGLRAYLKKPYGNLLICDFICGGLPSHRLFREYMEHFTAKGKKVTAVSFRPKVSGWSEYYIQVSFSRGKDYLRPFALDPYFSAFLRGKCSVRESCLQCPFATAHESDLTLADFWEWKHFSGIENDNSGLSLLIVNTQRGSETLSDPGLNLELSRLPLKAAESVLKQPNISETMRRKRELFLQDADACGLIRSARKHTEYRGAKRLKRFLKSILHDRT